MKVLITSTPGAGHMLPLFPYARAILDAGDNVLFCVRDEGAATARAAGFDVHVLPDADLVERNALFASVRDGLSDEAAEIAVGQVYAGLDAPAALPSVLEAIDRFEPDVILAEVFEFAGATAAVQRGIPLVRGGIMLTRSESWGMSFARPYVPEAIFDAPRFTLTPRALDDADDDATYRFAESTPVVRRPEEPPLVLLTFGSVTASFEQFNDVYGKAIEQLASLPIRLLVTTGRAFDPATLGELPANVEVEHWVPLAHTLTDASLVVHHGGFGTTRATACAGVPSVVHPMSVDQSRNAARIDELRAGVRVGEIGELRAAVERVLADPSFEVAAKRIRLSAATLPLVGTSVEMLREIAAQDGSAGALSSAA